MILIYFILSVEFVCYHTMIIFFILFYFLAFFVSFSLFNWSQYLLYSFISAFHYHFLFLFHIFFNYNNILYWPTNTIIHIQSYSYWKKLKEKKCNLIKYFHWQLNISYTYLISMQILNNHLTNFLSLEQKVYWVL